MKSTASSVVALPGPRLLLERVSHSSTRRFSYPWRGPYNIDSASPPTDGPKLRRFHNRAYQGVQFYVAKNAELSTSLVCGRPTAESLQSLGVGQI